MKKNGFTLIEILVVATIIALLAAGAVVSYSSFIKQSRDARRRADLEQMRAAVEMYRSNVQYYPPSLKTFSACTAASLTNAGNTYLSTIPDDPKCPTYYYNYIVTISGCDNAAAGNCTDYTLGAYLEGGGSGSCGVCGTANCNYCVGPYGQK